MEIIIGLIAAVLLGIFGANFSERRSQRLASLKNSKNAASPEKHMNTISEKHVQECLYHPNMGRSIELVRTTIVNNNITPTFLLNCPITMENYNDSRDI